jgi:hypothetical protein
VIGLVEDEKITLKEAGEKIRVSYRQAQRIKTAVAEKGPRGLIHGNIHRPSSHWISEEVGELVIQLSQDGYKDFKVLLSYGWKRGKRESWGCE